MYLCQVSSRSHGLRDAVFLFIKKCDVDDTNNYRGITLISCLGKLFTSILNGRLLEWDKTQYFNRCSV